MKAIYDHKTIDIDNFRPAYDDRGFQYGDGFFETMIVINGHISLFDYHYQRILDALTVLDMEIEGGITSNYLQELIHKLSGFNDCSRSARGKLIVWRQKGGYYEPQSGKAHYLLTAESYNPKKNQIIERTGFCESVQNYPSPFSFFKRLSSLQYVMAGLEKRSKEKNDLILCDYNDNVSEMLQSNIFWIKGKRFYTPSLETGCIRGIMRSYLIDLLPSKGLEVHEVEMNKSILARADHIFSCNVTGLYPVIAVEDMNFEIYPGLSTLLPIPQPRL